MRQVHAVAVLFLVIIAGCSLPAMPAPAPAASQPEPVQSIRPDSSVVIGQPDGATIRPLLGVNAGPLRAGTDAANADLTAAYRQAGVNLVRTHDFYGALDISIMYPDRKANPAAASSYDFTQSDLAWKSITDGGFEPYFRLGDSWNNARPPADALERANLVKAAVEVLRHYRSGKWNGFSTAFRYVEVWNEPDNQQFWPKPRTPLEFFQLYCEAASAIKKEFPALKVGGPGTTPAAALMPQGRKWTQDFLAYVRQQGAPLDFFSWHMYSNSASMYAEAAAYYRQALDNAGFTQTVKHITEWNTEMKKGQETSAETLAMRTGGKGAAALSAAWIELQRQQDLEVSTFYRGNDTSSDLPTFFGLYYADGRPKVIALAFTLWHSLTLYPDRLDVSLSSPAALAALAGRDSSGRIAVLISNPTDSAVNVVLAFSDNRKVSQVTLNTASDAQGAVAASQSGPIFTVGANSVVLATVE